MDEAPLFVIAIAALAFAALQLAPLLLSWPQRMRWTRATEAITNAGCGQGTCPPLDRREVDPCSN